MRNFGLLVYLGFFRNKSLTGQAFITAIFNESVQEVKRFLILSYILFLVFRLWAQPSAQDLTNRITSAFKADTLKKSSDTIKAKRHIKIIQVPDTLTLSDFMMSIERVNDDLNNIRDSAQLSFESVRMGRKINDISNDIRLLRLNARDRKSAVNIKNTYLYQSFATELEEDNNHLRSRVSMLYYRTYHAKLHLKTALKDSVFQALSKEKNIRKYLIQKLSASTANGQEPTVL